MILEPKELDRIFRRSLPNQDIAELFSHSLIRAGEGAVLASSLSGRVRWFFLGESSYISKERALEIVARSVDAAMKSSELDPGFGKTIQTLANRLKKGEMEGLYSLPEPLAHLQSESFLESIKGSTLFTPHERANDTLSAIPEEERSPAFESRLEELRASSLWEEEAEKKLRDLPRAERGAALSEMARALKENFSKKGKLFLPAESGTNGLSSEALIELFNQTTLATHFREIWREQFPDASYPEDLKGIQRALLSWLKRQLSKTVEEAAASMPEDIKKPKWIDYLSAEGERDLLEETPFIPEALRQEVNALLSDGILSALSAVLEASMGEKVQLLAKRMGSEPELKRQVIACAELFVESAFNKMGEKETEAFERSIERLFEKLPSKILGQLGLSDLLKKKHYILRFSKEEKGVRLEMIDGEKRVVVQEISEDAVTEELFKFILKHKWARLLDTRLTSDSELFEEKLLEAVHGKKEEQTFTVSASLTSNEDRELLYLMKTPNRFLEVKRAADFEQFLLRIAPLIDCTNAKLAAVSEDKYERLIGEADQILALFEKGSPEFATLTHFKKELKKVPHEESAADSLLEALKKMEFSKEEIASHIDTLIWLFGNGYEPLLKKLGVKLGSSPTKKSDAPPLVYQSNLLNALASGKLRICLFLIRFNLQLAKLLHTLERSLKKAVINAAGYQLISTFFETIIPAGIFLWMRELASSLQKWLLKKLLLMAARGILPSEVKLEREWLIEKLSQLATTSLNPKELDFSAPPPKPPTEPAVASAGEFTLLQFDNIDTGRASRDIPLTLPVDAPLPDQLETMKRALNASSHPASLQTILRKLFSLFAVPVKGSSHWSDRLENPSLLVEIACSIIQKIDLLKTKAHHPGSELILGLHQILATLDHMLVTRLQLSTAAPFFRAPRLKSCRELENSAFFSSPDHQERYLKLRGYFYPQGAAQTDPFSVYFDAFPWIVASESDLYLLKAAERGLTHPFPEGLPETERAIRIREECLSSRAPTHTPELLHAAFRLMLYVNCIDLGSYPLDKLSEVNLQVDTEREAFRLEFQTPLLLRMLRRNITVKLKHTFLFSFESAISAYSRERDSLLHIRKEEKELIPYRHPESSLIHAMQRVELSEKPFYPNPLLKPGVLGEQIHSIHDLDKLIDSWEERIFKRALKKQNSKLLSNALDLLIHVKAHYAYYKGRELPAPLVRLLALDPELCDFNLSPFILTLFAALPSPDEPLEDPWTFASFVLQNSYCHTAPKNAGTALIHERAERRRIAWVQWSLKQVEEKGFPFKEVARLAGYPTTSTRSAVRQGDLFTDSIMGIHFETGEIHLPRDSVPLQSFFQNRRFAEFLEKGSSAFSLDENGTWVTEGRELVLKKSSTGTLLALKYFGDTYHILGRRGESFLWMHPETFDIAYEEVSKEGLATTLKIDPIPSLAPLTAFTAPENIILEWSGHLLKKITFFEQKLSFDVVEGVALGRDTLAGFRLAKRQQHPKLRGFPSYLLLENETGGHRALVASGSLYASPLQPLLSCLGPFEPLFLKMVAESSGSLFSQGGFTLIDISASGEFLQVDPSSTLFLLSHALLSGNSEKSEELFLAFCSFAAREPVSVDMPGELLIASLPYSNGSKIRLKVAAAIEENRLLREPCKASQESAIRLFEIGLLLFDLERQLEKKDLVTAREEYLLYQKLLKGISLFTFKGGYIPLLLQAIPTPFSERYKILCDELNLPASWSEEILETATNLLQRGAELLPTLVDLYLSPQLALIRLFAPGQESFASAAGQSINRAISENLNLFAKTRWSRELFKPLAKVLPLILSGNLFSDRAFDNWMRYFDYYKKPLAELPLNEESFWFFYKAALGELGAGKREEVAQRIDSFEGIGSVAEFAYIELLKTALEHPYIMPSWQKVKEGDDLGLPRWITFLHRILAAKLETPLLRSAGESTLHLGVWGALHFISARLPVLRMPLQTAATTTSIRLLPKAEAQASPLKEDIIRDKLREIQREVEAKIQEVRDDLFLLSPAPKRSLEVLPTAEGTRLARSSAEFAERETESTKHVAYFRGEERLYPALFRLQNLHSELAQTAKERKEALLLLIEELTGKRSSFHRLSSLMQSGHLRKWLASSGVEKGDIDLIEWEWIATVYVEVNLERTGSIMAAIEDPNALREALFKKDFVPFGDWPREILLKALLIEKTHRILLWEKQVAIISKLLEASSPRILIEAIPGIGKTDVLSQIIEQIYTIKGFGVIKSTHAPIAREFAEASSRDARALKGTREHFFSLLTPHLLTSPEAMRTLYILLKDALEEGESLHLTRADLSLLDNRFFEGLLFQTIPEEALKFIERSLKLIQNRYRLLADEPQLLWKPRDLFVIPVGKRKPLPRKAVKMMERVAFELYQHQDLHQAIRNNKLTLIAEEEYRRYKKEVAASLAQDPYLRLGSASLFNEAVSFLSSREHLASASLKQNPCFETLSFYRGILNVLFPLQMGKSVLVNYGIGKEGYAKPFVGNMEPKKSSVSRSPLETLLRTYLVFYTTGIPPELMEKAKNALLTLDPDAHAKVVKSDPNNPFNPYLIHAFVESSSAPAIPYFPESIESSASDMVSLFHESGYTAMTGTISGEKSFPGEKQLVESLETMGEAIAILQKHMGGLHSLLATTAEGILQEVLVRFFKTGKFTALIDGGAEQKGLNSLQVASRMVSFAKEHAPHIRGVRFFQKCENGVGRPVCWLVDAAHPKPLEMVDLKLEEMWTYYSDLEGTGANLKLAKLDALILVSDRSGLAGTSLDAQIQYCFRVRSLLESASQTAPCEEIRQKIHFAYRSEAERAIFGDDERSLLSLLAFNHSNETEQVVDDNYLSLEQQMKGACKRHIRVKIFNAATFREKRGIAEKYRALIVSKMEIDPVKLWSAPLLPADPLRELSKKKEQLATTLPPLRKELETLASATDIPLPKEVTGGDFNTDIHLLAELEQEAEEEQSQERENVLFQSAERLPEIPETAWQIKNPLKSPKGEKRVSCFSNRFQENDLPTARSKFSQNLFVTEAFLPLVASLGSPYQRDLTELLIHGSVEEGEFILESAIALSQDEAKAWKEALRGLPRSSREVALLYCPDEQVITAGSHLPRETLIANREIALFSATLKLFKKTCSYTKVEKSQLLKAISEDYFDWLTLLNPLLEIHPPEKVRPLQKLFKRASATWVRS